MKTNSESGPDVNEVEEEWDRVRGGYGGYEGEMERNWNARFCRWSGQTDDQKKRASRVSGANVKPFPWNGASDLRVPVVDEEVKYAVSLDMMAMERANVRAEPVGMDDLGKAAMATNFARWLLGRMRERRDEGELVSQNRHQNGIGVMKVYWHQELRRVRRELSMEELGRMMPVIVEAMSAGESQDETVALLLEQMFGENGVNGKRSREMVRELRGGGKTWVAVVEVDDERPRIKALTVGEDFFVPMNASTIDAASAVYERVLLTPEESRARVVTDGWDEAYVMEVAEKCAVDDGVSGRWSWKYDGARHGDALNEGDGRLVEWIYAYQKRSDDDGNPCLWLTIFCPEAGGSDWGRGQCAKQEVVGNGGYPFVAFKRERLSRCLLDSRGIPETSYAWQQAIKTEMDQRIDVSSLATCPPRYAPYGRPTTSWGPDAEVQMRHPGEYGYIQGPGFPNASIEVQAALQKLVRSYNGRPTDALDQAESQTKLQKQVNDFLWPWKEVMRKVWELYMEYGKDEEFFHVLGVPSAGALKFAKAEFSAKYDFELTFDVLSLDPETYLKKLKEIGPLFGQWDSNGQVNREALLLLLSEAVFGPVMTERLILPKETAANREIAEVDQDISKISSGLEIDPPAKTAAQLRLQRISQWKTGSQAIPAFDVQNRLKTDQLFAARVERYEKQLQFQIEQQQNAQIGRQGAAPAYSQ